MSKLSVGVAVSVVCASLFTARVASAESPPEEPKDRATAFGLSAGGTLLSIGLTAAGVGANNGSLVTAGVASSLITPAAGELYVGQPLTWGMVIRGASAVAVITGFKMAFNCGLGSRCGDDEGSSLLILGGLGYATGIVYDIATAGSAVDRYNKKHHLQVTPVVARTASSGQAYGVGVSGRF